LPQLAQELSISTQEMGKTLRMLLTKSYAKKQGNALLWGGADLQKTTDDEQILSRIASADGLLRITEEESESPQISEALKILRSRNYIKTKSRKQRSIMLTAIGQQILDQGVEVIEQVNQLTEAMLLSGSWREASFRPYDVQLETAPLYPGKAHPLRRVLEETRRAFLNMGFTEIRGPYTESAFWDFDALFQPQDHPAREMQDTFYCKRPDTFALPQRELVEVIRKTHEDGGSTGSTGWRYCWSEDKARRVVLRTHTTAVTVSACHLDSHPPQKVFTVGRVFRRESIDYKHLPEFHQVDGVIIDTHASFASLLGTLREFYFQMGFSEVKFRPDFFPYTEPSVGVFVRIPGHNEWLELGGAGVFRPEVVLPAGVDVPVLAWGLGLERLAMIRYNIRDIRQLYLSHLDWLQQSALAK
jgi:phenylalanyl-tRNA synthetase alpha chain